VVPQFGGSEALHVETDGLIVGRIMEFKKRTLMQLAGMICGNFKAEESFFKYRSSSHLTEFFEDCKTEYRHNGSTRNYWVAEILHKILAEPQSKPDIPPDTFLTVIRTLMIQEDAMNEGTERAGALALLNSALAREGFEAFYASDKQCYLRNVSTDTVAMASPNPHRPFSPAELKRREELTTYLDHASEDELIEDVLLPLFRQLGFHRITSAGHKDKVLGIWKGRMDEVYLADYARSVFRNTGKKRKVGRVGREPSD
jgi:hypothetical protein